MSRKPIGAWLGDYFDQVAGVPPPSVSLWGAKPSLLAQFFAGLFFAARCLSPLQHIKRWQRTHKRSDKSRPDFEARDTEVYFITIFALAAALYAVLWWIPPIGPLWSFGFADGGRTVAVVLHLLLRTFAAIVFFESFVWVSYYLLWRNFAEPVFTLFHPAEYFVLFPLMLGIQCFSIALWQGQPVFPIFVALLGGPGDDKPIVAVLSQYFMVVIIANLLSMFPTTKFRASPLFNLIGAGDVVARKMVPALLRAERDTTARHLHVYSLGTADDAVRAIRDQSVRVHLFDGSREQAEKEVLKRVLANGSPAIIASPSNSHFRYLMALNAAGVRFAVEKPITSLPQEIKVFIDSPAVFRDRMFALSYYGLEKALPLTYLLTGNHHFESFLKIEGGDSRPIHFAAPELLRALGKLKSFRIDLVETAERSPTADSRAWTEEGGPHGLLFETMIHVLLLAHKLLQQQGKSIAPFAPAMIGGASTEAVVADATTFLRFDGTIDGIEIALACGKYADAGNAKRGGSAVYEHGRIDFDFDALRCSVQLDNGRSATLRVSEPWCAVNYAVQMDLVDKFFKSGWTDIRFDDFEDQVVVLRWIRDAVLQIGETFSYGPDGAGFDRLATALSTKAEPGPTAT
ncbi:hypothetical protein P6144_15320 [Sphingomonas sp. HITSZ_GF]|uniref:Gfo/Idh/MocA family oxidoreductase n=1 Tax=Sphingomonas sp. HITSZ_GF TaxID=3037247 RepID=UPI00240DCFFE|nr:Gfo/Idh/MocA family oxidoreductase [Sphingomonas sp. HITSZ_GF]MDG2535029.1 hypothetical protein [Sphingomonas sp. HITSZ_GF]